MLSNMSDKVELQASEPQYGVPRSPLTDAATDVGWHLGPDDDATWLHHFMVGRVQRWGADDPDAPLMDGYLGMLPLFDGVAKEAESLLRNAVVGARQEGATWTAIGESLGISKQTAYSRWGSLLEQHPNGNTFIVDILHDRNLPMARLGDPDHRPMNLPDLEATEAQRLVIQERLAGTEAGSPEHIDKTVAAVTAMARSMTKASDANWDDPAQQEHFLDLALSFFKLPSSSASGASGRQF